VGSSSIIQAFRKKFIDQALRPFIPKAGKLTVKNLEAFRRREVETAVQLFLHVERLGATMADVATLLGRVQRLEQRQRGHTFSADQAQKFREGLVELTREEKKHLRAQQNKDRKKRSRRKK